MAFLVKRKFFKNDDVSNYLSPFLKCFFFMKQKDNIMLVIIHAKFEVNSCCGWDYRQGGGVNLPPPLHAQTLP